MCYSDNYFTTRESWRDWRIEARELMDLARVGAGTRVLEIGCGGGGLLRLMSMRGAYAVGVDTLENALQLARQRRDNPTNFLYHVVRIAADGALPFHSGAFDALVAQHVVEHLADLDSTLCEWQRVIKPGGWLALATPNAHYPDPAHYADPDHAHIFAPNELGEAVARAGFTVEACTTIFALFWRSFRAFRALGVVGYRIFRRAPYFATRGRTIVIAARKPGTGEREPRFRPNG